MKGGWIKFLLHPSSFILHPSSPLNPEPRTLNPPPEPSLPPRLLIWLIIQLLALLLGAFGVPIFARHPDPKEMYALHEMVAVQIGFSALIFPWLVPSWRHGLVMVCSAAPFLLLSGWVSEIPDRIVWSVGLHVGAWMGALTALSRACRSVAGVPPHPTNRLASDEINRAIFAHLFVVLIGLWSIGGALLFYFHVEFMGRSSSGWFGPLVSALQSVGGEVSLLSLLPSLLILAGVILVSVLVRH